MEATFETFDRVLSFAGIKIFCNTNNYSKLWMALQIYSFVVASLALTFTTGFIVVNATEITILLKSVSIWSTCVTLWVSLGICLVYRDKIREHISKMVLVDGMLTMPFVRVVLTTDKGGKRIEELKDLIMQSQQSLTKFARVFLKTYVFCVVLTATMYLCDPIYRMIASETANKRQFAYDMWFPWRNDNFIVYLATFIYHAHAGYLCGVAYPGLQSVIILLLGQLVRQIRIMSFIMTNLNELISELNDGNKDTWQEHCTIVLTQCVKHYVGLKSVNNKLNVICRPLYLTLLLSSALLVGMCSVQIVISDFTLEMLKFYVHEVCFIFMVLALCFVGQKLESECDNFGIVADECWYKYDAEYKKNLLIFKTALIRGMPIYVFGSITLSLPTFTWFLRTGMSFFTLVMSLFED